jgi:hypothetical protein
MTRRLAPFALLISLLSSTIETLVCGGVSMEPVCSAQPRASPE